jgi:hypothetical protein
MHQLWCIKQQVSVVAVAQLVESRIVIPVVVGSSPISHPKRIKKNPSLDDWDFFFWMDGWSYYNAGRRCQ